MEVCRHPVPSHHENLSVPLAFREKLTGSKTLEEAWNIIDNRYGDVRMQLKCIKQDLMNMKAQPFSAHKGIISMTLAVNKAKR